MELIKLKALLGINPEDTNKDIVLGFVMGDITESITNYCNIVSVPEGLTNTAYRMAIDLYRAENIGDTTLPQTISSISIGGTSTSFANTAETIKETLLKDYRTQLNKYRRIGW